MKWCKLYNCFCDEVVNIIDKKGIECDLDCDIDNCDFVEEV